VSDATTDFARALTEAAKVIHSPRTEEETLLAIALEARRSVPGFDHVGISISHRNGKIETMASTDDLVGELDDLQYDLMEGPCVDSVHSAPVVVVENARHEQRWPRFIPEAVKKGLRAQLALRLFTEDETLGSINLYSTTSDTVDPNALAMAELFAAHAAIALGRARYEHQLNDALGSRKTIGQAVGLVMERYRIDEDRAFHFLVRVSRNSNIKLRDVAQELVDGANDTFRVTGERVSTAPTPRERTP
jgi:GAF domain-containing protein